MSLLVGFPQAHSNSYKTGPQSTSLCTGSNVSASAFGVSCFKSFCDTISIVGPHSSSFEPAHSDISAFILCLVSSPFPYAIGSNASAFSNVAQSVALGSRNKVRCRWRFSLGTAAQVTPRGPDGLTPPQIRLSQRRRS